MRLIIYIGQARAGSTALQTFLAQNSLGLLRRGILYPPVDSSGFAHFLAKGLKGEDVAEFEHVSIREPHSTLAYKMMAERSERPVPGQFKGGPGSGQMLKALRNQAARLEPQSMVLASEVFANFGDAAPGQIDRLIKNFPGVDLQIYCALRRPDEYLVSWHGQRLKTGKKLNALRDVGVDPYKHNIHTHYEQLIAPWIERCPQAKISLRNYSDIVAAGGSVEDFAGETGLDLLSDSIPVGRHNQSLPYAAMEIVRRGNHQLPPPAARSLRDFLLNHSAGLGLISNQQIEMYGQATRDKMMAHFAPIHDRLSQITGQAAFFPDLDEICATRAVPELDAMMDTLSKIDPAATGNTAAASFIEQLKNTP